MARRYISDDIITKANEIYTSHTVENQKQCANIKKIQKANKITKKYKERVQKC